VNRRWLTVPTIQSVLEIPTISFIVAILSRMRLIEIVGKKLSLMGLRSSSTMALRKRIPLRV
jgi:hypothetical protein